MELEEVLLRQINAFRREMYERTLVVGLILYTGKFSENISLDGLLDCFNGLQC